MDEPRGWIYDRSSFRAWCPACDYKPEVLCPLHAAAPALLEALENLVQMYPYAADTYAPWTEARAALAAAKGEKS